jgi:hypothetical protein
MSIIDARNKRGEIQTIPNHWLASFPEQFSPLNVPAAPAAPAATPKKPSTPAKAGSNKEG